MAVTLEVDTKSTAYKSQLIAEFIAAQHERVSRSRRGRPLMVSMQGPQGAGKSTLAAALVDLLSTRFGLRTAVASLDDFYLTRAGLDALAEGSSTNAMLSGRGPPGTHDADLLASTLAEVSARSTSTSEPVTPLRLPIFDKSLFDGRGDRSTSVVTVEGPIDVFILEGWSMGFRAVSSSEAQLRWSKGRVAHTHPFESVRELNDNLAAFDARTSEFFHCHVAIEPRSYEYVYRWRLQQEHHMKRLNGGKGMSDEAVREFVDRYMPSYEVFGGQEPRLPTLKLVYGEDREVDEVVREDEPGEKV